MADWGFLNSNYVPGQSFAEFARDAQDVPSFPEGIEKSVRDKLKDRTVNEVKAQLEFLEDLAAAGKRAAETRIGNKLYSLKNIDSSLSAEVEENAKKRGLKERTNLEEEGMKSRVKDAIQKIGLVHARIPDLLAAISGSRFGRMFDIVTHQFDAAADREIAMKNKAALALAKAYESSPRTWGCFLTAVWCGRLILVFPTYVGVFLYAVSYPSGSRRLPHVRGGVSFSC